MNVNEILNSIHNDIPDLMDFFDMYSGNFIIPVEGWDERYAVVDRMFPEEYKTFYDDGDFDDPCYIIACKEFWD